MADSLYTIFNSINSAKIAIAMTDQTIHHEKWRAYIVSTPDVIGGKPRIVGTRIPVALILGYLAGGSSPDEIIHEYPDLKPEHITACLGYARDLAEYKVV